MAECKKCGFHNFFLNKTDSECRTCGFMCENTEETITMDLSEETYKSLTRRQEFWMDEEELEADDSDLTKEWIYLDIFDNLLREFVEALIKVGASPNLKQNVLKIWSLLLHKLGLKITKENSGEGNTVQLVNGYFVQYDKKNVMSEFLLRKGNTPNKDKGLPNEGTMSLGKLVSLIYLGLCMTSKNVLVADVFRWILEGDLPVLKAASFFSEFKLDQPMVVHLQPPKYNVNNFAIPKLWDEIIAYKTFLPLDTIPQFNLHQVVGRFVVLLNLPRGLIGFFVGLAENIPSDKPITQGDKNQIPEIRILAVICLGMKILFGLDGKTESELSAYARILKSCRKGEKPFVFNDWLQDMLRYIYQKSVLDPPTMNECKENVRSVNKLLAVCQKFTFSHGQQSYKKSIRKQEVKDAIKEPFLKIVQNVEENDAILKKPVDFKNTSVSYLLQPKQSWKLLSRQGYKVTKIFKPADSSKYTNINLDSTEKKVYFFKPKFFANYIGTCFLNGQLLGNVKSYVTMLPESLQNVLKIMERNTCIDRIQIFGQLCNLETKIDKKKKDKLVVKIDGSAKKKSAIKKKKGLEVPIANHVDSKEKGGKKTKNVKKSSEKATNKVGSDTTKVAASEKTKEPQTSQEKTLQGSLKKKNPKEPAIPIDQTNRVDSNEMGGKKGKKLKKNDEKSPGENLTAKPSEQRSPKNKNAKELEILIANHVDSKENPKVKGGKKGKNVKKNIEKSPDKVGNDTANPSEEAVEPLKTPVKKPQGSAKKKNSKDIEIPITNHGDTNEIETAKASETPKIPEKKLQGSAKKKNLKDVEIPVLHHTDSDKEKGGKKRKMNSEKESSPKKKTKKVEKDSSKPPASEENPVKITETQKSEEKKVGKVKKKEQNKSKKGSSKTEKKKGKDKGKKKDEKVPVTENQFSSDSDFENPKKGESKKQGETPKKTEKKDTPMKVGSPTPKSPNRTVMEDTTSSPKRTEKEDTPRKEGSSKKADKKRKRTKSEGSVSDKSKTSEKKKKGEKKKNKVSDKQTKTGKEHKMKKKHKKKNKKSDKKEGKKIKKDKKKHKKKK